MYAPVDRAQCTTDEQSRILSQTLSTGGSITTEAGGIDASTYPGGDTDSGPRIGIADDGEKATSGVSTRMPFTPLICTGYPQSHTRELSDKTCNELA